MQVNIWMSKYWREYRRARRHLDMNRTQAKRFAKFETQIWYHMMKQTEELREQNEKR